MLASRPSGRLTSSRQRQRQRHGVVRPLLHASSSPQPSAPDGLLAQRFQQLMSMLRAQRLQAAGSSTALAPALLPPPPPVAALHGAQSALLWFKGDLRVDDHTGLLAVAASPSVEQLVPLYVIDSNLLWPLLSSPAGPEVLVAALSALRSQLQALGSDLVVRTGDAATVISSLLSGSELAGPAALVAEVEAPGSAWDISLQGALAASSGTSTAQHVPYYASAWHDSPFDLNYRRWQSVRGAPALPLGRPQRLPPLPADLPSGAIPTAQQLRELGQRQRIRARTSDTDIIAVAEAEPGPGSGSTGQAELLQRLASDPSTSPRDLLCAYLTVPSTSATANRGQGSDNTLRQLMADATAQGWSAQRLIGEAAGALEQPCAVGGSFNILLGSWLEMGALSRRQLLQLTSPNAALPARVLPDRAAAARRAAELSDFHHLLAERGCTADRPTDAAATARVMQWRWRGLRNEYIMCEPAGGDTLPADAPAILLVHGFGAFGDQWRGNMAALSAAGFRVYAPTLPGFGRSEKAALPYSQDLWRDFLADFTINVVGAPVVVAGNSIGGFIAASMAADMPELVAGLVLLNSAGPVTPGFSIEEWRQACEKKASASPPPRLLVQVLSRALFLYLELTIAGTLKRLYPTNPSRADEWLAREIYRAACDLGSIEVFQSAFYLPPPRALNYLIAECFQGPTLVLQGALDPLNDAKKRAADLAAACPGADLEVVLLQAGHCPHDEQPERVNLELLAWIKRRVLARKAPQTPAAAAAVA